MSAKLDGILALCETVQCRRQHLLEYFGETSEACGNCDNCLTPPEQWDGTEAAAKLMSCIYRCESASGYAFGAQQIIDVLRGQRTEKVLQRGHDRISTFGIGAELDAMQWRGVLRQLVMLRLVDVDQDNWNVLRLTSASRPVLKGERRLQLRRPSVRSAARRKSRHRAANAEFANTGSANTSAAGESVFQALRAWRLAVAREHKVPAYTVLHDASLREIAQRLPTSLAELHGIAGIGAAKLERYGVALIGVVGEAAAG